MNTIDITNSLEKDKLVNTEQSQLTDTQLHHGTSYVSHFEPHASKKPNSTEIKISAQDAHVYYGDFEAIKGIDLDIYQNEVIAFIGPSGCGKSTFLRTLNRMNDTIDGCRV
ncbi:ATP-binding cassette domain-containing protein, partial [Acinetobacter baumannii]